MPEKMEFTEAVFEEEIQNARLYYEKGDEKVLVCNIWTNYKTASIGTDIEDELVINGDADKLARVFDNILRNAVSYCYADTPIRISAHRHGEHIQICFANKGTKIPEGKLQTIFELWKLQYHS